MNKQQFRQNLARAGYSPEQIAFAESVLRRSTGIHISQDELRRTAWRYLLICTEIDKLRGFILLTDGLMRVHPLTWEESANANLAVVVGWCH
jgi:hypothetical protein